VRLDSFLKLSRLCPRRTIAQKLCDAGFVLLNDRPAKSAHAVKAGDVITIKRQDRKTVARVMAVPSARNISRRDSSDLIEVETEESFEPLDH
jgi:ribosomal 50S subunit-recycling heat shock protein